MADQQDAQTLASQHRLAQLQLRARALRDYLRLWPIWKQEDASTFPLLVSAALPLVRTYNGLSATLAASFYQAIREAEDIAGAATPRIAGAVPDAQLAASLYVTGQLAERNAMLTGATPAAARETALARTSGAVTRQVLQGGRDTLTASVEADREAIGWARVTDGDPCAFCLTLASRGAVYKSEQTASFEAHDHCGCSVMPLWEGTELPSETQRWLDIYDQAQRDSVESGLLQTGENSSAARINAVRRYLATQAA